MNTAVKSERRYGGRTIDELRSRCTDPTFAAANIVSDLLDDLEQCGGPELLQRMRRVETKVHKIAVHVGAEPDERTTMMLSARDPGGDYPQIQAPGYDITLAQIRRLCEQENIPMAKTLYVMQGDALLATLRLTARK